jgi:hypothetical protein
MTCREASIERTLALIRAVSVEEEEGEDNQHHTHTTTLGYLSDLTLSFLLGNNPNRFLSSSSSPMAMTMRSPFSSTSITSITASSSPSSSLVTNNNKKTTKKRTGINIQHCPNCDVAYSVPINCFHVTCETYLGGCGIEFCFICSAIRSPILAHGNMMHRYSCPFNIDQYCCSNNCLRNHQEKCCEMQWSPHCTECQKNERGEVCSFPLRTPNDEMKNGSSSSCSSFGKHWKILNLTEVQRELEIIQGGTAGRQEENS